MNGALCLRIIGSQRLNKGLMVMEFNYSISENGSSLS